MKPRLLFVLEQSLGHATHGHNIERAARTATDIDARTVRITGARSPLFRYPVLRNWSLQASWEARRQIRRQRSASRVDAMYIHSQVVSLLSSDVMRRVPTVISLDATPINYDEVGAFYAHRRGPAAIERLKRQVNRRAFDHARMLVAFSHWAARSLVEDYGASPDKVRVIRSGVDMSRFQPAEHRPGEPVRILFVGGDFVRKGGHDLLAAFTRIDAPVELDIVTTSRVGEALATPRTTVHVGVRYESQQLLDLYRRADVFVLPSRSECYGHAIAEAMACGLPVVACDVGAVSELVRDGENGFLVPRESPTALAAALDSLVASPELRAAMGRASLETARREHDADCNNRMIIDLMKTLAAS